MIITQETLDLIYNIDNIASIAMIDKQGAILENHLPLVEDELAVIVQEITKLLDGFASAGRGIRGFVIQSESINLVVCVYESFSLVLEVIQPCSITDVHNNVTSLISSHASAPTPSAVVPTAQITNPVLTQPASTQPSQTLLTPASTQPVQQPQLGQPADPNAINFAAFHSSLVNLIKRVAPGGLAEKMVNNTFTESGVDLSSPQIDRVVAVSLGKKVIDQIPNKSRRKMIHKEFDGLAKSL